MSFQYIPHKPTTLAVAVVDVSLDVFCCCQARKEAENEQVAMLKFQKAQEKLAQRESMAHRQVLFSVA